MYLKVQVMAVLKDDQKAQYQAFSVILVDKIKNLGRDNQVDQSKCMGMGMGTGMGMGMSVGISLPKV